jgi:hypothetical protein
MSPNDPVGMIVDVISRNGDEFHDFIGTVKGVRNGLLQVIDQDDNGYEVEPSQVEII